MIVLYFGFGISYIKIPYKVQNTHCRVPRILTEHILMSLRLEFFKGITIPYCMLVRESYFHSAQDSLLLWRSFNDRDLGQWKERRKNIHISEIKGLLIEERREMIMMGLRMWWSVERIEIPIIFFFPKRKDKKRKDKMTRALKEGWKGKGNGIRAAPPGLEHNLALLYWNLLKRAKYFTASLDTYTLHTYISPMNLHSFIIPYLLFCILHIQTTIPNLKKWGNILLQKEITRIIYSILKFKSTRE